MDLIKNWVLDETNLKGMRPEATKWGPGFDIEDLDETGEVGSG